VFPDQNRGRKRRVEPSSSGCRRKNEETKGEPFQHISPGRNGERERAGGSFRTWSEKEGKKKLTDAKSRGGGGGNFTFRGEKCPDRGKREKEKMRAPTSARRKKKQGKKDLYRHQHCGGEKKGKRGGRRAFHSCARQIRIIAKKIWPDRHRPKKKGKREWERRRVTAKKNREGTRLFRPRS